MRIAHVALRAMTPGVLGPGAGAGGLKYALEVQPQSIPVLMERFGLRTGVAL